MSEQVWVFVAPGALNALYHLPSGVFRSRASAQAWIEENKLTGILAAYPVDTPCIDWAIDNSSSEEQKRELSKTASDPKAMAAFASDLQEHYFFENGQPQ